MPRIFAILIAAACITSGTAAEPKISGELKQWHKLTLTVAGPEASETDENPNPFTYYAFWVEFRHESGEPVYRVPGYFAADGNAAETSATRGNKWRAHLSPDKPGEWRYHISFRRGENVALEGGGEALEGLDGLRGGFRVAPTDKEGRDFRAKGRLEYMGEHYLRFAGTGDYFLKAGADAPETLLAYADFDGTEATKSNVPLKTWAPHVPDWREGDPTWKDGKGKGLIGALNYLAGKGCNAFSFLPYNAGGDGDNVWPFISRKRKLHYDCSKLDQWEIIFEHADRLGLFLHFKLQETEMDDNRHGGEERNIPTALNGGRLGIERKLYLRELIARFGHHLALNWNLGEENTQSTEEQKAMARCIAKVDPYDHLIVVHTYPGAQDEVYEPLLGKDSPMTGASLQNHWNQAHQRTLKWVKASAEAGKPWVVANDEQGPANLGVPPDPGYKGFSGTAGEGDDAYDLHDIRKRTLWGTLMAGGAGVEYYFGYELPQNDLLAQDWRSRDASWDYCRIALEFFKEHEIPFWEMTNTDEFIGNASNGNGKYCFAKPGQIYLVYLPEGGTTDLDLTGTDGRFRVEWFNPREGGALRTGTVKQVEAGRTVPIGNPPGEVEKDWLAVIRK